MADIERKVAWSGLLVAIISVLVGPRGLGGDTEVYIAGADALLGRGSYADVPYPPGFPALLAPLRLLDLPLWWVASLAALTMVVCIWWAAYRMGGPFAAAIAAAFSTGSWMISGADSYVMSDAPAAALVAGAIVAATYGRWKLVGLLLAGSTSLRMGHAIFALASRRREVIVPIVAVGLALLAFNVAVYGRLSGYEPGRAEFALRYLWEPAFFEAIGQEGERLNAALYPQLLMGRWDMIVPLLPLLAGLEVWRRREDPVVRFGAGVIVLNVVLYLPYFFQSHRFMMPATVALVVLAACGTVRLLGQLWSGIAGRGARVVWLFIRTEERG